MIVCLCSSLCVPPTLLPLSVPLLVALCCAVRNQLITQLCTTLLRSSKGNTSARSAALTNPTLLHPAPAAAWPLRPSAVLARYFAATTAGCAPGSRCRCCLGQCWPAVRNRVQRGSSGGVPASAAQGLQRHVLRTRPEVCPATSAEPLLNNGIGCGRACPQHWEGRSAWWAGGAGPSFCWPQFQACWCLSQPRMTGSPQSFAGSSPPAAPLHAPPSSPLSS